MITETDARTVAVSAFAEAGTNTNEDEISLRAFPGGWLASRAWPDEPHLPLNERHIYGGLWVLIDARDGAATTRATATPPEFAIDEYLRARGAAGPDGPTGDNPLVGDMVTVQRWSFARDDERGGVVSGEFLLRSDGILLRRMGGSRYGAEGTTYHYGPWTIESAWDGGAHARACAAWLKGRWYDLYEPNPIGVSERAAGPFPGMPPLATPAAS